MTNEEIIRTFIGLAVIETICLISMILVVSKI